MDLLERSAGSASRHPWELARADFFISLMRSIGLDRGSVRWLDVGSGDGWLSMKLAENLVPSSTICCWDANYTATDLLELQAGATPSVSFSRETPEGLFDVISLFDVIEHVQDDEEFLRGVVAAHCPPGGIVVLSVPAHQILFGNHDVELRHFRRYSPDGARRVLEASGLEVDMEGGLFASLLPVRGMQVALEKVRRERQEGGVPVVGVGRWQRGQTLSGAARRLLEIEGRASMSLARRGRRMPGLSYWAVCHRRSQ